MILSMDTTTSAGKVAFNLVRTSKSSDYPDGNVNEAYNKLKKK